MFKQAVQLALARCTGTMRGPLGTHRLPAVLGQALAPALFHRTAAVLVCLSDDKLCVIVRGLHIVPADKTSP